MELYEYVTFILNFYFFGKVTEKKTWKTYYVKRVECNIIILYIYT